MIVSPPKSTVVPKDGAVRSVQMAELTLGEADWRRMWNATNLENLARTYWLFLSRVTLGLIRVVYGEHERSVVFLGRRSRCCASTLPSTSSSPITAACAGASATACWSPAPAAAVVFWPSPSLTSTTTTRAR